MQKYVLLLNEMVFCNMLHINFGDLQTCIIRLCIFMSTIEGCIVITIQPHQYMVWSLCLSKSIAKRHGCRFKAVMELFFFLL